ncbi:MAG: type II toxin-antitoxin system HicA family toxin [Spirochaetaceae bacterium]|nr:type II toxin-antitoxin system HicA family toxin [Spirochaetaceae bacterium]
MAAYEKQVRKILSRHGCTLIRHGKGDHEIWYSPTTKVPITVDGEINSRHTANGIMKRAGVDHHF